jgi:hypothetical protein
MGRELDRRKDFHTLQYGRELVAHEPVAGIVDAALPVFNRVVIFEHGADLLDDGRRGVGTRRRAGAP